MSASPSASACAEVETMPAISGSTTSRRSSTAGLWDSLRKDRLQWLPELGLGFYPVSAQPYDAAYFANYAALADTDIGRRLNAARVAMVARHWEGLVVDIGIGAGTFVDSRSGTKGYDVNPVGVAWLKARGLFVDPYAKPVDVVTTWDALEHILDPAPLLANVRRWVFVSLPIFHNVAHVMGSKHYKPSEHAWYFTDSGFRSFMAALGWRCVEVNDEETQIGREDIKSYAFRRAR
jgi:hypothetical protein